MTKMQKMQCLKQMRTFFYFIRQSGEQESRKSRQLCSAGNSRTAPGSFDLELGCLLSCCADCMFKADSVCRPQSQQGTQDIIHWPIWSVVKGQFTTAGQGERNQKEVVGHVRGDHGTASGILLDGTRRENLPESAGPVIFSGMKQQHAAVLEWAEPGE